MIHLEMNHPKGLVIMIFSLWALLLGFLLDLCFGDPHWLPHPIRLIGKLIEALESVLRRVFPKNAKGELAGGVVMVALVCLSVFLFPCLLLWLAGYAGVWLQFLLESLMCYQLIAAKSLRTESMKVFSCLLRGDVEGARAAVSMIVGRDTQNLSEEGITKAAVETVAENTSDGVIAPLLFLAVGGAPLGFLYKAVNTMDSMVGYKNQKYLYFGRAAAKLDDWFNYIPSRLSAFLMLAASGLLRMNVRNAWRIYRRDNRMHASPNSAQTEAVCAGALEIQLAGNAVYFGKLHKKPTIGDPIRKVRAEDIRSANRLMYGTSFLMLIVCAVYRLVWIALL